MLLGIGVLFYAPPQALSGGQLGLADLVRMFVLRNAWSFSLLLIPLSMGIAVLRYRLYDIDIIIRRTLIYGVLTVTLALAYFVSVVALQTGLRQLTGQGDQLAIVVSTLGIAALFVPVRRRIQAMIDRRFYRSKYDAEKVLAAFGATVREEVDLERLSGKLLAAVRETMQPAHVSLWMRPTADRRQPTADARRRMPEEQIGGFQEARG